MEISSDRRLLELVDQLKATMDAVAQCSVTFPRPLASFVLLDSLASAQSKLAIVYDQLAHWHIDASDGAQCNGDGTKPSGPSRAATALVLAAQHAKVAADALMDARTANSTTRWYETAHSTQVSIPTAVDDLAPSPARQLPTRVRAV